MTTPKSPLDALRDFAVACFCKEGGAPHESNTGTCKHIFREHPPVANTEPEAEEAPACALCETETDEAVEECSECGEFFHPACIEGHECEKE